MEVDLMNIAQKPNDFKICKHCNAINWYENESCCNTDCNLKSFKDLGEDVIDSYKKELNFFMSECGYTEDEADDYLIEV